MLKLVAIADDLTGANDTALQFAKRQIKSSVHLGLDSSMPATASDVVVIDSDSRDMSRQEAYRQVYRIAEIVSGCETECIYKKIDSTLRGNWGAEVKAADDVFQPELVIIAPAYPVNRRITMGGYHLLDGQPLELTEIGNAPKTPVHESYIPDILQQQVPDAACGVLDFSVMKKGEAMIRNTVEDFLARGIRWIICDIAEEQNFMTLMDALRGKKRILWVGSAGLADYISYFYGWEGDCYDMPASRDGPVLICAGSVSHTTQQQIKRVCADTKISMVKLDVQQVLSDADSINAYGRQIQKMLAEGKDVLLVSAENDADVRLAVNTGRKYHLSGKEVSEKLAVIMAGIVSRLNLSMISGMVLTGGDTAVHICRALGVEGVEVFQEIMPAVPLGRVEGKFSEKEKVFIVTKAGAFGSPEIFTKALQAIKNI